MSTVGLIATGRPLKYRPRMPASPLSAEQLADAARLHQLFREWQQAQRDRGERVSQESVVETLGFGQSALSQYLNGKIPLNIKAAAKIAALIGVEVADFSPSLAAYATAEVAALNQAIGVSENLADLSQFGHNAVGRPPKISPEPASSGLARTFYNKGEAGDQIVIPHYETGGSMGNGLLLRDQPGLICSWEVSPDWFHKNLSAHSGASNLCIVTGFGDSMRGMFNSGDPLLVDRGVIAFEGDGVYFFRCGEEGFIKRLQRMPAGELVAISENKSYEKWTITPDIDFQVLGRVLKVWRSEVL